MIDEQRLAELPTYSRMAWSSRPIWDRRPAAVQRRDRREDLGVAGRHRCRDGGQRRTRNRTSSMARSESLVGDPDRRHALVGPHVTTALAWIRVRERLQEVR